MEHTPAKSIPIHPAPLFTIAECQAGGGMQDGGSSSSMPSSFIQASDAASSPASSSSTTAKITRRFSRSSLRSLSESSMERHDTELTPVNQMAPNKDRDENENIPHISVVPTGPVEVHRRGGEGSGVEEVNIDVSTFSRQEAFHCHVPRPGVNRQARNQIAAVTVLCFIFMIAEIIGGTLANSLALVSDATHLASDLSGFIVSLAAISVAAKRPSPRLSFGYYRTEVLGALVSILIIWVTTGVLVYLAIQRVIHQDYTIEADSMLITAGAGVAFNIIMGIVLNSPFFGCEAAAHAHGGHGHSHGGHGHSHGDQGESHGGHSHNDVTEDNKAPGIARLNESSDDCDAQDIKPKKKEININVKAAFIHIIGDLFQSVGVLIAAFIIKFKPEYKLADPICTFLFSILVLVTTVTVLRDTILVLLEGVPRSLDYRMCQFDLETLDGVKSVHSLNIWALSPDRIAIATHIAVDDTQTGSKDLLQRATKLLRKKYSAFHTTIQIEDYRPDVMNECEDCRGPKLC